MKVLLVEDDEEKREQLTQFVQQQLHSELVEVRSFQSAKTAIKNGLFDLILLDMTMPTFDIKGVESGGRTQPFGGKMLLFELQRRNIKTKVIVVTQFDFFGKGDEEMTLKDLNTQLAETFKDTYLGSVQYNEKYTGWKEILLQRIQKAGFKISSKDV